jgi:hypothetical protein
VGDAVWRSFGKEIGVKSKHLTLRLSTAAFDKEIILSHQEEAAWLKKVKKRFWLLLTTK